MPQQATLLELFFDVVFVAALAVISTMLSERLSWSGFAQAFAPLAAIWLIWTVTTLLTDFYDPERPLIQTILAGTMLGTVLAAVSVTQAFRAHGLLFAGSYVAVHLGRGVLFIGAINDAQVRRQAGRFLFGFSMSAVPWLLGGLTHGPARGALWAVALAMDYAAAGLRYPTPLLGRVPLEHYRQAREHLGERYRQFVILALGDIILVATLRFSGSGPSAGHTSAFLLSFLAAGLLWRLIVLRGGTAVSVSLPRRAGGTARFGPFTHLGIVTAVVAMSAGFEEVIEQPGHPAPPGEVVALLGGATLFVAARIVFDYAVFYIFSHSRTGWLLVLIAITPVAAALTLPSLLVLTILVVILVGISVTDQYRLRLKAGRIRPEAVDPRRRRGVAGT